LKIDTEGNDLDVLQGGEILLANKAIDVVEVEASMNKHNRTHVPFEKFKSFLEDRDYFLFGVYEQVHELWSGDPQLRRANLVFLSENLIAGHRALRTE
jgi:hypothetical protein